MTEPPGSEPRILVWAVPREGHTLDRILLDVRPGRVRVIDPNLRARFLQQLPLIPGTVLLLAIVSVLFAATQDTVTFLVVLVGLITLFLAGIVPYSGHVWGFLLREPRGAFEADVVETDVGRLGNLFLHLRIHRRDLGPASGLGAVPDFPEDRWLACGQRRRVLAVLRGSP